MQSQHFNYQCEIQINYDNNILKNYEVNFVMYNYMIYFQIINEQKLGEFVVRP